MIYGILSSGDRTASLLKASPKGEGFQPSPSETLIDPNESDWATRLHELIGIPVQAILTARKELVKTASVTRETFEDEETKRLYASLRNFQRATIS